MSRIVSRWKFSVEGPKIYLKKNVSDSDECQPNFPKILRILMGKFASVEVSIFFVSSSTLPDLIFLFQEATTAARPHRQRPRIFDKRCIDGVTNCIKKQRLTG